jgi:hypothetical protein
MHRTITAFLLIGSVALLYGVSACSSSGTTAGDAGTSDSGGGGGGDAGCRAYVPDAGVTTPAVSLSEDVMPLFQQSCGIAGSTCHGSPIVTTQGRPFLDYPDGGSDAATVLTGIVGQPSTEDPQMSLVKAGDPAQSFMMHKLDGDQCTLASACAKGGSLYQDCGQQMPYSSPRLDQEQRDTIRRWIAQGAQNN